MSRPRLLDLFCGAGGCAVGYDRAGFDVVGVDSAPQKRYPFEFHQADAMTWSLDGYDVIHASPPCQMYSLLNARHGYKHTVDLVDPIRQRLIAAGVPHIIENVPGAPLHNYTLLCGTMFGLRTIRHRLFECSIGPFMAPRSCCHTVRSSTKKRKEQLAEGLFISVTGNVGSYVGVPCMGIDWMHGDELSQAIPPAYTEYIGTQLLAALAYEEVAV